MSISIEDYLQSGSEINYEASIPLLPICHTTKEFWFFEIILNHVIKSHEDCSHFKEPLVFFFYGKAKYIPTEDFINGFKRYLPVTLIFNIDEFESNPKRMLPFDSGGFARYKLEMNAIDYYVVSRPSTGTIITFIKKLYGSNEKYLKQEMSDDIVEDDIWYPIYELKNLCDSPNESFGEQAYTIELQYEDNDKVWTEPQAIVMPFRIFSTVKMKDIIIKNLKTQDIIPYNNNKENSRKTIIAKEYFNMQEKVNNYMEKYLK